MTDFLLGPTSATAITFYPEFDFKDDRTKLFRSHRLQNGDMYSYKTGMYDKFSFKVRWFPASDAAVVNSWWESDTELLLWIDSDVSSVMLVNRSKPVNKYQRPYTDLMTGSIKLEGY